MCSGCGFIARRISTVFLHFLHGIFEANQTCFVSVTNTAHPKRELVGIIIAVFEFTRNGGNQNESMLGKLLSMLTRPNSADGFLGQAQSSV
jgi:hypothetical protein